MVMQNMQNDLIWSAQ